MRWLVMIAVTDIPASLNHAGDLTVLLLLLLLLFTKQRSLVIALLDLKNAFGEVHHNLIQTALDYHHIPDHIKSLVKSLYTDFKTSILTNEFRTPFISVGRGVLQGDCLSPLLFNLCFNTFLQHIRSEKHHQFGFSLKFLNPIHWFQFADDDHWRTGNFLPGGGGGGKPFAQKTLASCPNFYKKSRTETRAIRCNNIGRASI